MAKIHCKIIHQTGRFWVAKAKGFKGFEVWRDSDSGTHAERVASIGAGRGPNLGIQRAKFEAERRHNQGR